MLQCFRRLGLTFHSLGFRDRNVSPARIADASGIAGPSAAGRYARFWGASMFLPDGFDPRAFFSCARDF
jgi:hypothetical protein